jgi:hypothetical protein
MFRGESTINGGPILEHRQSRKVEGFIPRNAAASLVVSSPCIFVIYPVPAVCLRLSCLSNSKARPNTAGGLRRLSYGC